MKRCVYCQGRVIPLVRRCLRCHRRQPSGRNLEPEWGEASGVALSNAGQEEVQSPSEVRQRPLTTPSQRHLSRRTVVKVAGLVGVGLGAGMGARLISLLVQNHTLLTYRGHDGVIWALAWSSDSQRIASTSGAEVQVWEALSGRLIHRFPDQDGFEAVAWSQDGAYLATGSWGRTVSVWQVATGQKVLTYRGHVQGQAFDSGSKASLTEWDDRAGLHPSIIRPPQIESLAWSPDGTRLLSSDINGTTLVWEALTGTTLLSFSSVYDFYRTGAWSPDGQHLLMHTKRGIERHLATTGALEFTFSIGDDGVNGPSSWSQDGSWLATLSLTPVDLWNAATGRQVLTYEGNTGDVLMVAWSPDSSRVASASTDLSVRIWKAANGQTEYTYRGHMSLFQLLLQGGVLPTMADSNYSHWSGSAAEAALPFKSTNALLPKDTGGPPMGVRALAWAPNGRYLASGRSDNTVQVWQPG